MITTNKSGKIMHIKQMRYLLKTRPKKEQKAVRQYLKYTEELPASTRDIIKTDIDLMKDFNHFLSLRRKVIQNIF